MTIDFDIHGGNIEKEARKLGLSTDKIIKGKSLSEDLMNATLDGLGIKEEDVKDKGCKSH